MLKWSALFAEMASRNNNGETSNLSGLRTKCRRGQNQIVFNTMNLISRRDNTFVARCLGDNLISGTLSSISVIIGYLSVAALH